jgi:hypothetical protein
MGSTLCVRCGENLKAHSYCGICHEIISYACSACSLTTDERIHSDCQYIDNVNNINSLRSQVKQKYLDSLPIRSAHTNTETYYASQNQLNEEMKYNSIKLLESCWNNLFESIRLANMFWSQVSNTSINNLLKYSTARDIIYW